MGHHLSKRSSTDQPSNPFKPEKFAHLLQYHICHRDRCSSNQASTVTEDKLNTLERHSDISIPGVGLQELGRKPSWHENNPRRESLQDNHNHLNSQLFCHQSAIDLTNSDHYLPSSSKLMGIYGTASVLNGIPYYRPLPPTTEPANSAKELLMARRRQTRSSLGKKQASRKWDEVIACI